MALWLVRAFTLAPWRISRVASGKCPWRAATWRGVKPSTLQLFTPRVPACCTDSCGKIREFNGNGVASTLLHGLPAYLLSGGAVWALTQRVAKRSLRPYFSLILLFLIHPLQQVTHLRNRMSRRRHVSHRGNATLSVQHKCRRLTISTSASATARSSFSTCQSNTEASDTNVFFFFGTRSCTDLHECFLRNNV